MIRRTALVVIGALVLVLGGDAVASASPFAGAHATVCVRLVGHTHISLFGQPYHFAVVSCR